ncbi:MAG: tetratricopeptide repeat protein [Roseimicrobium sp.]
MPQSLLSLRQLLAEFEGFRDLGMWQSAQAILDGVPAELADHPDIVLGRLDVLVGTNQWDEALRLSEKVGALLKNHPEAWYDIACAHSQQGNIEAAMDAVKHCVSLDRTYCSRVLQEPLLAPIWTIDRL